MRLSLPSAITAGIAGALVLVAGPAAPASAATSQWAQPGSGVWSDATSWSAGVPTAGDDLVFPTGARSENDLAADAAVGSITLSSPGVELLGSRIRLAGGLNATAAATTDLDIVVTGSQAWTTTGGGAAIVHRGEVRVESGTLSLSGSMEFAGRLDGLGGAGGVVQDGQGTVVLSGSGGAIGGGYRALAGDTHVTGQYGGTDVVVDGGVLSGGSTAFPGSAGAVRALTLSAGALAPGPGAGGAGIATFQTWEPFTADGGSIRLDVGATSSDRIAAYRDVSLDGGRLELSLAGAVPDDTSFAVITSTEGTISGLLADADGAPLADGAEFDQGGERWRIGYGAQAVTVTAIEALAPTPSPSPTPTPAPVAASPAPAAPTGPAESGASALASTGFAPMGALGVVALLFVVGLVLMTVRRRRRTRR